MVHVVQVTDEGLRQKLARLTEQLDNWQALEEEWGSIDRLREEADSTLWLLKGSVAS